MKTHLELLYEIRRTAEQLRKADDHMYSRCHNSMCPIPQEKRELDVRLKALLWVTDIPLHEVSRLHDRHNRHKRIQHCYTLVVP
jgi:hypothetical protein